MLVVETIARIRREYFVKGKPIKEIVRDVKVSRNTVRKVIRSQATAFTYDRRVQPMPKLGPWTAELERMLEANERHCQTNWIGPVDLPSKALRLRVDATRPRRRPGLV